MVQGSHMSSAIQHAPDDTSITRDPATRGCHLVVLIDRYRPILGGAQNNIHELGRRLTGMGFRVTVLTRRIYADTPAEETIDGVEVRRLAHAPGRLLSKAVCIAAVIRYLVSRREDYDIVMSVPCTKMTDLLPLLVAGPLSGRPYVIRSTGMADIFDRLLSWPKDAPGAFVRSLFIPPFVWRRIYRHARAIIVQSRAQLDRAERFGIGCELIPNGADTDRFRSATADERRTLRDALGLPDDRLIIVATGRYSNEKNQLTLIKAVEQLEQKTPGRVRLLVLGATERQQVTSNEENLKAYVRERDLGATVRLFDDVRNVEDYLRAADVYSIPSYSDEGMSNSLVEAMACGLPVVSSSIPQNVAVLPEAGARFFDPHDVDAVAHELDAVLADEQLRRSMGAANAAHADTHYANHRLAKRYGELFGRLTGRGSRD